MSQRPHVAGVDTSTQSCKVVVVEPETGRIIRQGKASHPDGTQVHPDAWWDAFEKAVEAAGGLDDVAALSVGGQQHGMVLLDEDGQVLRPALLWNDTRSADAAEALVAEAGAGDREAGAAWWADAIGSVPVASFTVTKLRWVADTEPEVVPCIAAICLPHDWLTWRIKGTGRLEDLTTDRSDASGTGYAARVSAEGGPSFDYRRDILATALRITPEQAESIILPKILGPWDRAGVGDPARGWDRIVLGPGTGDNAGAALGVGLAPGDALLSLGTSGVVSAVSAAPVQDRSGLVAGFADASGNWLPLACTLNASRIVDAMMRVTGLGYDEFDEAALSVPDAGGLELVPYFEGERTPNLPDATGTLSGMTLANSDQAHVARAGIEGLLRHMRYSLDAVRALGAPIERVLVVGGGAKSTAVRALAAEFLDARVEFPEAGEYVALGAARQAARVLG
ncbi:xylulose kinase [Schaalia sp. 19OD2882]|uniref:xylulokinase n=1 Tax=Schaalia sp. 19OD2882 TaxID=2794089 RepID=UPI001C1F0696|nr:FGGY-family carbohydrate kinase [Schaalia sp. 19OD2882]QWW19654.1 xylulose kinase [Schaalia sp. 19OD2882]